MRRSTLCLLALSMIVPTASAEFFIDPGEPPPLPEPQALTAYSYAPLGWDALPPGLRAAVTDDGLRIRAEPLLSAEINDVLNTGDEVVIVSVGPEETICGLSARWYEIADEERGTIRGWVFGGYLKETQCGDWRDDLLLALKLVREGDVAGAHEALAGLTDDAPATLLTESHHPALAILYNLPVGADAWRPVRIVCGPDYGLCLFTEDQGGGSTRVYDDRWLVWDAGAWVFGPQFFCDLTTGVIHSPIVPTSRAARYIGDGLFLMLIHRYNADPGWINSYQGTDAQGHLSGVALYSDGDFTLMLPEECWYSWRQLHAVDGTPDDPYFIVSGLPNRKPDSAGGETVAIDMDSPTMFRVGFDPEAGKVTSIIPLDVPPGE